MEDDNRIDMFGSADSLIRDSRLLDAPLTMKDLPESERPYEKAESGGVRTLTNAELVAVLLSTGRAGETAVQTAQKALVMSGGLSGLLDTSLEELQEVPGIGRVKSIRILAAVELGQRAVSERQAEMRATAGGPDEVIGYVEASMRYLPREEFHVLLLDTRNRIIKSVRISQGGLTSAVITLATFFARRSKRMRQPSYLFIIIRAVTRLHREPM